MIGHKNKESPGERLLALAAAGGGTFDLPKISGREVTTPVEAHIGHFGLGVDASGPRWPPNG